MGRTLRTILACTAVSGTLDILSAFFFSGMSGVTPAALLRYVASGPFGDGMKEGGAGAAALGLGTHYVLMTIMVTVFVLAARRLPALLRHPFLSGGAYGIIIYFVMYWLVVPARFARYPKLDAWSLGNALFSHILCVGIPMALVAAWMLSRAGTAAAAPSTPAHPAT